MNKPKIKICGMTRSSDTAEAVALGVDAIGMILHADSPRLIDTQAAKLIRAVVPQSILLVGVYVDAEIDFINQQIAEIGLDLVQLHGDESDDFGRKIDVGFIKAIRARTTSQVIEDVKKYPSACALLLDPYVAGQHGGTGKQLDLRLWPKKVAQKLVLAGGLSATNANSAAQQTQAYALDLNSGVETSPGCKSVELMGSAIEQIRSVGE